MGREEVGGGEACSTRWRRRAFAAGAAAGLGLLARRGGRHAVPRGPALVEPLREPGQRAGPVRRPRQRLGPPRTDGPPQAAPAQRVTMPSVYRRLLGPALDSLPPTLRDFHDVETEWRGHARFRITRARGRLRNLVATLGRLPPAGEAVAVRLRVVAEGARERWL